MRVGLVGAGIIASRSPAMHVAEARALGIGYAYDIIDVDVLPHDARALPAILDDAERRGFRGLNVTHPFKRSVLALLTDLSDDARVLGAVNTVLFENGKRTGHNTDWWGFAESVRHGLPDARLRSVVLLGAGGAGAAVAYAALTLGAAHVAVFDAEPNRAEELASRMSERFGRQRIVAVRELERAMARADGLIHATPTGMEKYPGLPVAAELLRPGLWVADIVYLPLETELLRVAGALGCRLLNGRGMAVFQAARAFELFTGIIPDADRMARSFDAWAAERMINQC